MTQRRLALLAAALLIPSCSSGDTDPDLPPPAPTGLVVVGSGARSVRLGWVDPTPYKDGFHVWYRLSGVGSFVLLKTVGVDVTSDNLSGLDPSTAYDFQVTAYNQRGDSSPSNPVTTSTGAYAWTPLPNATTALQYAQAVYVPAPLDRMIVFGGVDDGATLTDDLYLVHPATGAMSALVPATPVRPGPRFLPSLIYDSRRNSLILFGGNLFPADVPVSDVWEFDLASSTWAPLTPGGTPPIARNGHSAVYDSVYGSMLVFGGANDFTGDLFDDVHRLILPAAGPPAWQALSVSGTLPVPRDRHTAIFDPDSSRMIVFGGTDNGAFGNPFTNELSALSLDAGSSVVWTRLASQLDVPAPRAGHAAVYDAANRQIVVFGGQLEGTPNADYRVWTLSLDGMNVWNEITLPAPRCGPRMYAAAAFDAARLQLLLVGGNSGAGNNDPEIWALQL